MANAVDAAVLALVARHVKAARAEVAQTRKLEGPQGAAGPQGERGEVGPQGAIGPQGERGEVGPQGAIGPRGERGEVGPQGAAGRDGIDGAQGATGPQGEAGPQGEKGEKGDTGPAPDHQWDGSKLRFRKPDGKWGKYVDLRGPKGEGGKTVVVGGGGGGGGADLSSMLPGAENVEPVGIAVQQGASWVNLPWGAFISTIAGAIDMASEFSRRTDFVGDSVLYRGEAAPGAAESAAVWRVRRIEFLPDGDVVEKWAGGVSTFSHVWADRTTLTYI